MSISSFQQSTQRSLGLLSHNSQSASEEELVIIPLTSGNWGLDQTLETHLDICCILLQVQYGSVVSHKPCPHEASFLEKCSRFHTEINFNTKQDNMTHQTIYIPTVSRLQFFVSCFWMNMNEQSERKSVDNKSKKQHQQQEVYDLASNMTTLILDGSAKLWISFNDNLYGHQIPMCLIFSLFTISVHCHYVMVKVRERA